MVILAIDIVVFRDVDLNIRLTGHDTTGRVTNLHLRNSPMRRPKNRLEAEFGHFFYLCETA